MYTRTSNYNFSATNRKETRGSVLIDFHTSLPVFAMKLMHVIFNKVNREHSSVVDMGSLKKKFCFTRRYHFGLHNWSNPFNVLLPFSYHLQATYLYMQATEYDDKVIISICFQPTSLNLLCQWAERLIFSHNRNQCCIKFLCSQLNDTQGVMYRDYGLIPHVNHLKICCILCSTVMHCSALYMHNSSDRVPVVITNFIIRSVLNGIYTSSIHLILVAFASSMWCQTWK